MECQSCKSERLADVTAKCNDMCMFSVGGKESDDYAPIDVGLGGGSYVDFCYCLDCGQMQGEWPVEPCILEEEEE